MQDHSHNKAAGVREQSATSEARRIFWMPQTGAYNQSRCILNTNLNEKGGAREPRDKRCVSTETPADLSIC